MKDAEKGRKAREREKRREENKLSGQDDLTKLEGKKGQI